MLQENIEASFQSNIIISTSRLTKAFGRLVAVNDLHLQVMRGAIFGFLGPNGSGKTTTIRMLLGLIRPSGGQAQILGYDVVADRAHILPQVVAIVETPTFYPYLSGRDNLRHHALVAGVAPARIAAVLEVVELT